MHEPNLLHELLICWIIELHLVRGECLMKLLREYPIEYLAPDLNGV